MGSWFEDVGAKIKNLAIVTFVVEAAAAIISGISIIANDSDLGWIGILTMIGGFGAALVTAWFLYGFGELIEKTVENEQHTKAILSILREKKAAAPKAVEAPNRRQETPVAQSNEGNFVRRESKAPYWCGKCGNEGPYDTFCPQCGSSIKIFNNPVVKHTWVCRHCGEMTSVSPCEHCGK